jgi:hypothetical protein
VKGGQIEADDVGQFLRQLNMQTTFTWDMHSSDWFLTMKMLAGVGGLDIEKYSALNDTIFSELSANRDSTASRPKGEYYKLYGSDGKPIPKVLHQEGTKYEVSAQVSAFAASLNWLAMRTCFYSYLSNHYDADAVLHPIRSAFQLSIGTRLGLLTAVYEPIVRRFADETSAVVKEIKQSTDPVVAEMQIPLLSAWLVDKVGSPSKAVSAAFEFRNESPVRDARKRLSDLAAAKQSGEKGFVRDANRLVAEVRKAGDLLRELYAVKPKNGVSVSPLIAIFNVIGKLKGLPNLPTVPLKIPLPDKIIEIGLRGGFKGMCRSVIQDLVAVSRLGAFHEKMTAEVKFREGHPTTYLAKTEDVHFLGKSSHWKRPM